MEKIRGKHEKHPVCQEVEKCSLRLMGACQQDTAAKFGLNLSNTMKNRNCYYTERENDTKAFLKGGYSSSQKNVNNYRRANHFFFTTTLVLNDSKDHQRTVTLGVKLLEIGYSQSQIFITPHHTHTY